MAIYFKWKEEMSVDEQHIDEQHQQLLNQINKIIDAMVFGIKSKEVSEAIEFFDKYYKEHFSYEESYMKENAYPEIKEHVEKHGDFIKKYFDFKKRMEDGSNPENLIMEMETFLGHWWIEHIGNADQKYHKFIKDNLK